MANANSKDTFLSELASVRLYKWNQGKLARQVTMVLVGLVVASGALTFYQTGIATGWFGGGAQASRLNAGLCFVVAVAGFWFALRVVNYPKFADFLISVEAEMDKVTWASKDQLYTATIVVISTMLFLGLLLFIYDLAWMKLFKWLKFLEI